MFPSPYGVSFILILVSTATPMISSSTSGFRLLTEYHSFLLNMKSINVTTGMFPSPYGVIFILTIKI